MKRYNTPHFNQKIIAYNFPSDYPTKIFYKPDIKLTDILDGTFKSVKKLIYNGKLKDIEIVFKYDTMHKNIKMITITLLKPNQVANWLRSRRCIIR